MTAASAADNSADVPSSKALTILQALFRFPQELARQFGSDEDIGSSDHDLSSELRDLPFTANQASLFFWPGLQLHTRYSGIGMAEIAYSVYLEEAGSCASKCRCELPGSL